MRIAYLDCFSGISGDMFLAALVHAGVSPELLRDTVIELNRAGGLGVRLAISRAQRSGISSTKVDVLVGDTMGAGHADQKISAAPADQKIGAGHADQKKDEPRVEHHHYHAHEHGHTHEHAHANVLGHSHQRTAVEENGHQHSHGHRGLSEIRAIVEKTNISAAAKARALAIFQRLGEAEAKIHDIPVEQVHFHEVGAADAITDIVCAAVGSETLNVDQWICSPLNVGSGSIECAHGRFPVPAPATAELLRGAPMFSSGLQAELVTPTGAAIAATLASRFAPLPEIKISKIGYGAGTRDFTGHANVVRLIVGESVAASAACPGSAQTETVSVLECTIDDLSPQVLAYASERVLADGALDVFSAPVQMKKNRLGTLLTVLARPGDAARLAGLIFRETSTLGIRVREERRFVLPRQHATVATPWGKVRIKVASFDSEQQQVAPEYEDCRRLAEQHAIPLKRVIEEALRAFNQSSRLEPANHS